MSFDRPAPDLLKIQIAWEKFERGDEQPGRVLADMKTAGFTEVLNELIASGWSPNGQA